MLIKAAGAYDRQDVVHPNGEREQERGTERERDSAISDVC